MLEGNLYMSDRKVRHLVVFVAFLLLMFGTILFYIFDKYGLSNQKINNYINYNINDYVEINSVTFDSYYDIYDNINVSKVFFKNIDKELTEEFTLRQNELIDYINRYYYQMVVDDQYVPTSTVLCCIKTFINGPILSVFYKLDFNLDEAYFEDNNKSYILTLNIDLVTNKVLTNEELLSKYNYSKSYIGDKLFNEEIMINKNEVVVDKNTNISLTRYDIERKKEVYINRIVSEFNNIIEIYIEENSLVLVYNNKDLKNIFFDDIFDTNIKIKYLK